MTWLALASIEEFEVESFGTWFVIKCPEHGSIGKLQSVNPVRLKNIFNKIKEHVEKEHKDESI